jgi:hypothetical protein
MESEFYFRLMPSKLGGIGVFAAIDIDEGVRVSASRFKARVLKKVDVPEAFHKYCIHKNDAEFFCPPRFDCMPIGWFINHSSEPNMVIIKQPQKSDALDEDLNIRPEIILLITCKKVFAGDEVFIDYNALNEPPHLKEAYYR